MPAAPAGATRRSQERERTGGERVADALVELHREHRRDLGLGALRVDPGISGVAANTASVLAWRTGTLVHRRAALGAGVGHDWPEQLWKCGLGPVAENLAWRSEPGATPEEVAAGIFGQWLSSPPHREVIETPGYTTLGIGVEPDARGRWWAVAHFARLGRTRCPAGALTVEVGPAAVAVDGTIGAIVRLHNVGPAPAEDAHVRVLVEGAVVAASSPSAGRLDHAVDRAAALVWTVGDVGPGAHTELRLHLVATGPGPVRVTVESARSDWSSAPGRPAAAATLGPTDGWVRADR
ncbi:MAG: CAP domain-containing protein [Actinomycetota bacterium]|nr:CAP domain-containing protein [Actinomycetota bacterium]